MVNERVTCDDCGDDVRLEESDCGVDVLDVVCSCEDDHPQHVAKSHIPNKWASLSGDVR